MKNIVIFNNCMMDEMWRGMMCMTESPLFRCALNKKRARV